MSPPCHPEKFDPTPYKIPPLPLKIFLSPMPLKIPKFLSHPQSRVGKTLWNSPSSYKRKNSLQCQTYNSILSCQGWRIYKLLSFSWCQSTSVVEIRLLVIVSSRVLASPRFSSPPKGSAFHSTSKFSQPFLNTQPPCRKDISDMSGPLFSGDIAIF